MSTIRAEDSRRFGDLYYLIASFNSRIDDINAAGGTEVVGSDFDLLLPGQVSVDPRLVKERRSFLEANPGAMAPVKLTIDRTGAFIVYDGHHGFVAAMGLPGVPVDFSMAVAKPQPTWRLGWKDVTPTGRSDFAGGKLKPFPDADDRFQL
jgi:hypothetical protein